ncbi:hypothetical protein ACJH6J_23805 [Mycobacterium sp. SMC-18]|uniref:hypothetical protein n=1 Tax=unclassified Mycobacterium TaxID=2642494 RepID=UPI003876253C
MLPTTSLRPWTFATAENGEGLTHTWIRDWATDRDRLHAGAAAAGWQSHCLLDVYDHALLRTLTVTASSRDKLANPRREPHILITVAPHIPWTLQPLPQLAGMGRAINMHLAVVSDHLRTARYGCPFTPAEFADQIGGWYPAPPPALPRRSMGTGQPEHE